MKLPLFSLLVLSLATLVTEASPLEGTQPNILLVITDDQGYAPVGAHGHPWIETPNMDKLFATSTRFDRMLVSPTCSPTRAALMTGRHPMKNGITHTILERERMNPESITLPAVLREAGYTTGIFGKWHLGDESTHQPENRGFDEVFIHGAGGIGQAYDCSCADAPGNDYFNPVIRHNGSFVKTEGYCTDLFFQAGLGWIKQVKESGKPFFAYISTNAPHSPFNAPPENEKKFTDLGFTTKTAGFYGMIENIDSNLGLALEKLKEWDLMENTVVIFMSDNGMTGGGSGQPGKQIGTDEDGNPMLAWNANMKGQKGSLDEGGVRVPFYVRWDGKIAADQQIDTIAAHLDIFPTLAALAGAEIPSDQVEGRSLLPLIDDPSAKWEDRYLFTHRARWPTGQDPELSKEINWSVRGPQFRLVGPGAPRGKKAGSPLALYDMITDPEQTTNVLDRHHELAVEMKAAYDQFWSEARPLMINEDTPMSPTRPYHVWFAEQEKSTAGIPMWTAPEL